MRQPNVSTKVKAVDVPVDRELGPGEGWHALQVRWLVSRETMGSDQTVIGMTVFPPGAKHDLHRHPNTEEWEYVLSGRGIKHNGGVDESIEAGDIVFTPRNAYHGVANVSDEVLTTIWGYSGAGSLEAAGYVLPQDDDDPKVPTAPWPSADEA